MSANEFISLLKGPIITRYLSLRNPLRERRTVIGKWRRKARLRRTLARLGYLILHVIFSTLLLSNVSHAPDLPLPVISDCFEEFILLLSSFMSSITLTIT